MNASTSCPAWAILETDILRPDATLSPDRSLYTCHAHVHAHETDFNNRLKVSALFNHMQDAASAHAEALGVGFDDLDRAGCFWVLSWVGMELDALPPMQTAFTIQTWPKGPHRLYSLRDFRFQTEDGKPFGRVTTAWLLLDNRTLRPLPLKRLPLDITYRSQESALDRLPEKPVPLDRIDSSVSRPIGYSDLDINRHMNNARYVEALMDAIPLERHEAGWVNSLTLHYQAEAKPGDVLNIETQLGGDGDPDRVRGRMTDGTVCFSAEVLWRL